MHASTRYALCTIETPTGSAPAIMVADKIWELAEVAPNLDLAQGGLMALFEDWEASSKHLSALAGDLAKGNHGVGVKAASLTFQTPLQFPPKIICAGTNYIDHIEAVGYSSFSKEDNIPAMFMKPPRTALVGPGKTVRFPTGSTQFDWEIELGVVIGKEVPAGSKISSNLDMVAGYMTTLDMSARDFQRNPKHFAKSDLFMGKAFDSSAPAGPYFVPADFIDDPQNLTMKLWRNGKIEQDSNTSKMIWSVRELLEIATANISLEPGDLLLTGTPAGTGIESGIYADVGDVIEAEIENLGQLRVQIYAAE
ncbi:fumarylacetoacetate hydrolase family protein [Sneathiella chinensis]|uniref:Fumarylacetoacetase-like C-terminal domain-containing protein n=1 Tax=Sneathiella chinensis TaxID=349750 RepID=A0ABQ5U3V1_9PROT|nr:fumarylacetoacetate hydrolase family protein [Sneathiella chinensis]GLQ06840.1 hypothetical protein GCM10007924_20610 [Sneathiella chinensis]